MNGWRVMIGIYAVLSVLAATLALWLRDNPLLHPAPWLELAPLKAHAFSALIGLTLGFTVVALTPAMVRRVPSMRTLHEELRPWTRGLTPTDILLVAILSSTAEELVFRSVLQPYAGLWLQAAIFGLCHQLPGRARWTWVLWTAIMGVILGVVFEGTGSLAGPLLAHATINGMNLRYLQHKESASSTPLGGVLGQRT